MRMCRHRASASIVTVAIVAGSWLAGCATDDDARGGTQNGSAPVTPAPTSTHGSTTEGSTTMTTGTIDPGLQPYIDLAVADLAARQSIDPADITVQAATLEVWSDASLGCPQPGQQYAQVVTDGSLIVLAADGHEFRYHAGGSRTPFLCEAPGKSLTGDTTTTL